MARKVVVEMVDDIDGVEYVIDLKDEHATELREMFEYYIAHSIRVGGRKHRADRSATPVPARRPSNETKKIRAWALEQGYELSSRGRIPAEIEQAFHDAPLTADDRGRLVHCRRTSSPMEYPRRGRC